MFRKITHKSRDINKRKERVNTRKLRKKITVTKNKNGFIALVYANGEGNSFFAFLF